MLFDWVDCGGDVIWCGVFVGVMVLVLVFW